jgi:hypothetical protein
MRVKTLVSYGQCGFEHENSSGRIDLHVEHIIAFHEAVIFFREKFLNEVSTRVSQTIKTKLTREGERHSINPSIPADYKKINFFTQ